MDIERPLPLLGGLSPRQFMRRHWQKKPLLVRGAIPGFAAPIPRSQLFAMAASEDVESRVVQQKGGGWDLRRGPFPRRALPPLAQPGWTLLVQGVDLHRAAAHELLQQFRFVPDARMDDLMISWASDGGGVGPHFDSYDVFLLQAHGQRRWRIARRYEPELLPDMPVKILANFEPEEEYVLDPGDMLYLPPMYAHDGIAVGECQTYSIGFRVPNRGELARELLQRIADEADDIGNALYRDAGHDATGTPSAIPAEMQDFARKAVEAVLRDPQGLDRALGEYLTEPKPQVWFDSAPAPRRLVTVMLDARTRMMYDRRHVFVNGESWLASGRDATLMRRLADLRRLDERDLAQASEGALDLLMSWVEAGWLHEGETGHA